MTTERKGPIDDAPAPSVLRAHVVTPGTRARIHGYDIEEDLALYYGFVERGILTMTGELPSNDQALCAEIALCFLSPTSVAEAPTNATVAARLCGATHSALLGIGAVTLAEQVCELLRSHEEFLEWLGEQAAEPPGRFLDGTGEDRRSIDRLRVALKRKDIVLPVLERFPSLTRNSALLASLHFAGLRRPEEIETMIVTARLAFVMAEALSWKPRGFHDYPVNLPLFEYEEDR